MDGLYGFKSVFLNNNKVFDSFIDDLKKNLMKKGFVKILGASTFIPGKSDALTLLKHGGRFCSTLQRSHWKFRRGYISEVSDSKGYVYSGL